VQRSFTHAQFISIIGRRKTTNSLQN
jgi:hypothetical protein